MEVESAVTEAEATEGVLAVVWEAGATEGGSQVEEGNLAAEAAMEEYLVMEDQVAVAGTAAAVQGW